jgi:hypothetical protein
MGLSYSGSEKLLCLFLTARKSPPRVAQMACRSVQLLAPAGPLSRGSRRTAEARYGMDMVEEHGASSSRGKVG